MSTSTIIQHQGVIESTCRENTRVRFTSVSACGACHAKGFCTAADMQDKVIDVNGCDGDYIPGETVNIILESSQGFRALFLGYIYPFLLLFSGLILFTLIGISELYAGLFSLALLVPYYSLLFLMRNKLQKKFQFTLRKPD
jgi:sigma-E factor negative regulatory protein RseC